MTKRPLTASGVNEVMTSLYALSNDALLAEADAVGADFRAWLAEHFDLTAKQEVFIAHGLEASFISFVQARLPFVFVNRLPVSYTVMGRVPREDDEEEWGKIIEALDATSQSSARAPMGSGASGAFHFLSKYYRK